MDSGPFFMRMVVVVKKLKGPAVVVYDREQRFGFVAAEIAPDGNVGDQANGLIQLLQAVHVGGVPPDQVFAQYPGGPGAELRATL